MHRAVHRRGRSAIGAILGTCDASRVSRPTARLHAIGARSRGTLVGEAPPGLTATPRPPCDACAARGWAGAGRGGLAVTPVVDGWRRQLSTQAVANPVPHVTLTGPCAQRIIDIAGERGDDPKLRLSVEAGGCSGFSYKFEIDGVTVAPKDHVFESDGAALVVDGLSIQYLDGATVDFVVEMVSESFQVINNPNSDGSCGCGVSFTPQA